MASRAAIDSSPDGGTGASSAAARTGRVASSRSTTAAPIECPISTGGAGSCAGDVLDVGGVVVEPGDEQRLAAARCAVAAQADSACAA